MNKLTKYIAISGLLFAAANAHAVVNGANGAVLADLTSSTTNNDFLNPLQVNIDGIFGGGWTFASKDDDLNGTDEVAIDIGFTITGGLQSGNWSVDSDFFTNYSELLLVIKGGTGNNTQPNYASYLVTATDGTFGTYSTPFFNANGGGAGNPKNISHITAYVRGGGTPAPVPEPSTFALFGAAFAMLGFVSYRSRKS